MFRPAIVITFVIRLYNLLNSCIQRPQEKSQLILLKLERSIQKAKLLYEIFCFLFQ